MDRRELFGVLGATAAGFAAVGAVGEARAAQAGSGKEDIHRRCAEICTTCEKSCNQGFHHCYRQVRAGKADYARAMHLCVDCGDICSTSGKLVARMSPLMTYTCRACAECCEECLKECERLNDPEMREVVETLRKCARSCREMVQAMGSH